MLSLKERVSFLEARIQAEINTLPGNPSEEELDTSFQWISSLLNDDEFKTEEGQRVACDLDCILNDIELYPNLVDSYFAMLDYINKHF